MITKEWLEQHEHLLEAIRFGKTIQRRDSETGEWFDTDGISPVFPIHAYRVKPVVSHRFINVYRDGRTTRFYMTREQADADATEGRTGVLVTTFRDGEFHSQRYEPLWIGEGDEKV